MTTMNNEDPADPSVHEPVGYLRRHKIMVQEQREAFPGEEPDYLWEYTHGTKHLSYFEADEKLEVLRVYDRAAIDAAVAETRAVPEGWSLHRRTADGRIVVQSPDGAGCVVGPHELALRIIPTDVLYKLCNALLGIAAPSPTMPAEHPLSGEQP